MHVLVVLPYKYNGIFEHPSLFKSKLYADDDPGSFDTFHFCVEDLVLLRESEVSEQEEAPSR